VLLVVVFGPWYFCTLFGPRSRPWPRTSGLDLGLGLELSGLSLGLGPLASISASASSSLVLASASDLWPRPWPQDVWPHNIPAYLQLLIKWYWGSQDDDLKQICTSLLCQTATQKMSRMFTQFHSYGFQMIFFYFCSASEPSEWSRNCCVVNFIFSLMSFKC